MILKDWKYLRIKGREFEMKNYHLILNSRLFTCPRDVVKVGRSSQAAMRMMNRLTVECHSSQKCHWWRITTHKRVKKLVS